MSDQDPTQTGGQEEEKLTPEELIAQKVNAEQAGDFQAFDEETGQVIPKEDAPEPEPVEAEADKEPESPASDTPEPTPEPPKTHKVKVLGQEEEVPLEELVRNYQKTRAADVKLQEASRIRREADEYAARIRQGQPSQDAGQQQQPTPPQGASQPLTAEDIRTILFNEKAMDAGAQFREEFPDIAADPHLMDMAARLEEQRLQTARDLGEPHIGDPAKAYRAHGEAIRKWLAKFKPADTVSTDKLEKKRTITAIPAAGARAPSGPTAEKPQTVSEQIEEERKSRGGRPLSKR